MLRNPGVRSEGKLTDRQHNRLADAITANDSHDEGHVACQCAERVRAVYEADTPAGEGLAETSLTSFPIPEIADSARP